MALYDTLEPIITKCPACQDVANYTCRLAMQESLSEVSMLSNSTILYTGVHSIMVFV